MAILDADVIAAPPLAPTHTTVRQSLSVPLLLVALLINALSVLVILPRAAATLDYTLQVGDLYDLIATNLAQGHGYRVDAGMGETMLREPGYPLLVATVFKIGGYGAQGPRIACVLLAFVAALLLLRLAQTITGNGAVALIAALLFLVYPANLVAEARAGVEIPCVFTVLLFMLAMHRAVRTRSLTWYGLAGLLLGIASLVRSEVLLFPSFLLVYFFATARNWHERRILVSRMLVLSGVALATLSPWILRNYRLVHRFVPTATLSGVAAQEGLYTCKYLPRDQQFFASQRRAGLERAELAEQLGLHFEGTYYYQFFFTPQDEVAFNRALLSGVSEAFRDQPSMLLNCGAQNLFFKFWFLGKTQQATRLNVLVQLPLLAAALGGIVVLYQKRLLRRAAMLLLFIIYVPLVHAGIIAHARHSIFVVPFLVVLAAVFLEWAWCGVRTRSSAQSAIEARV